MDKTKKLRRSRNQYINALLFADDQVKMANSEEGLQISIHKLKKLIREYGNSMLSVTMDVNHIYEGNTL
jgi:hypothetical protein